MKKMKNVFGLPVLDVSSGKKVGVIEDIFFNNYGEIVGFAVASQSLFNKISFLSYENVSFVGDDAVTIGEEKFITPIHQNQYYSYNYGKRSCKELPLVTTNGQELGYISDVYFMEEVGKIIGYEVSDGFISDITEGRRTIEIPKRLIIGEDAIVIPNKEVKDVVFEDK
ncbi:MAG: PRC-barrel domain-containing protein [Vulcanibacillus sp.]